ncbi:type VI secretion system contractile sheath large subunit [Parendozoicomonas sp. Alg238-R29]|uniref:type VI secretion system contractile sheath domain-containing protein n=1 Tax=Parendozoicomonas sp. Alg238-R29 TaxID=2993446 RepID=UPI00248D7A53|nr:type VI secretion system contractile sheath large subunit [Parendozoicomonas sp. Alg238-R29]
MVDYDRFTVVVLGMLAELDDQISQQLDVILADKQLQELHGRWLALWSLVDLSIDHRQVLLKIMHCTWDELADNLNRSVDIERSWLYDRLGRKELNTPGGLPFGLLLADYFPSSDPGGILSSGDDLFTLQMLASVGAVALCPVVVSIQDQFFGSCDDRLLVSAGRLERVINSEDFHSWQLLRKTREAAFLGVAWPMLLYHCDRSECMGFCYRSHASSSHTLQVGAGWAFACIVMREYDRCHWFGFLRNCDADVDGGGRVAAGSRASSQNLFMQAVASIRLSEYLENTFHQLGFLVAGTRYLSNTLAFHNNNSVMACGNSTDEQIHGLLQSTLIGCRFAHYLKVLVRDRIGSFDSTGDCERYLSRWLQRYVSDVDYGEDSIMARFPLKQARVRLELDPRGVGRYRCTVYLQPQYQYDQMDSEIVVHTDMASETVGGQK